jgi:diguanylate cyclase
VWDLLSGEAAALIANLPIILLQATSLLGILCVMLIGLRAESGNPEQTQPRHQIIYGLLLGSAGFMLTALVSEHYMRTPAKIYLSHDLLFLAGLLGGWRSGAIAGVLVFTGRLLFGGQAQALAAGVDLATITLGGMALHSWVAHRRLTDITTTRLGLLWLARTLLGELGLGLVAVLQLVSSDVLASLAVQRLVFALPSLALFYGIFAVFRLDGRHQRMVQMQFAHAQTDPLTHLPNRRALRDCLETQLRHTGSPSTALLTIETENYVDMLLAMGHGWSDTVWKDINRLLREDHTRDVLAPYRPRVFQLADTTLAVVLYDITLAQIEQQGLAVTLYQELTQKLLEKAGKAPYPHLRLAVADCNSAHYPSAEAILRDVSLRLQSLGSTGQPVHYWHQTLAQTAAMDSQLLAMLVNWVDTQSPPMGYQPKCDLATRVVTGAEALLRARDAQNAPIAPQQLLALAARHQLLAAFEWCTVEAVARDAKRCTLLGQHITLSVNISGASMTTPGFAVRVCKLLQSQKLPMNCMTLELTETSSLPDVESVRENVKQLGEFGIRMSLDDFGTGYSGLTMLARFPFAEVKIDYAMVALIEQPRMRSAIQIALESAQRYEATFVAEGVETQAQCDALSAMGIGVGQGYLFSHTLAIDDLVAFAHSAHGESVVA